MAVKIQNRSDTKLNWEAYNPILALGEIGFDTDTKEFKMGDGVSHWLELSYYVSATGASEMDGGDAYNDSNVVFDGGNA